MVPRSFGRTRGPGGKRLGFSFSVNLAHGLLLLMLALLRRSRDRKGGKKNPKNKKR